MSGGVVDELESVAGYDAGFGRGAFDGEFLLVQGCHVWVVVEIVVQRDRHPSSQDVRVRVLHRDVVAAFGYPTSPEVATVVGPIQVVCVTWTRWCVYLQAIDIRGVWVRASCSMKVTCWRRGLDMKVRENVCNEDN